MKVLCIIPVFNEEKFLKGTIASIKQHNFGVDKFLFFDSGSTDSSGKILKEEKYETITLSKNQGIGNILIKGIDYCIKNSWIAMFLFWILLIASRGQSVSFQSKSSSPSCYDVK